MEKIKESFISSINENSYNEFKTLSYYITGIGTSYFTVFFILSLLFYSDWIIGLYTLVFYYSYIGYMFLLIYPFAMVYTLDILVKCKIIEKQEQNKNNFVKSWKYYLTMVWNLIVLVSCFIVEYKGTEYVAHYKFMCKTFVLDKSANVYHIEDYADECNVAARSKKLQLVHGWQIEGKYPLCPICKGEGGYAENGDIIPDF